MVVASPSFPVVRFLTYWKWYAFLMLTFLWHGSTSCHWPSSHVSFSIFMSFLGFSLSLSLGPLTSFFLNVTSFLLRSRIWSQQSRISPVTHRFFFFWHFLPRSSVAVAFTTLFNSVTNESSSASSSISKARATSWPPNVYLACQVKFSNSWSMYGSS